jgi:hypothetical protein
LPLQGGEKLAILLYLTDFFTYGAEHEFEFNSKLRFFAVSFCGGRFVVISMKHCKTKDLMMKNFTGNTSENLPNNSMKSLMLKYTRQGGGGYVW